MRDSSLSIAIQAGLKVNVKRDTPCTPICIIIFARYITPVIRLSAPSSLYVVPFRREISKALLVYTSRYACTRVSHVCAKCVFSRGRGTTTRESRARVQFYEAFSDLPRLTSAFANLLLPRCTVENERGEEIARTRARARATEEATEERRRHHKLSLRLRHRSKGLIARKVSLRERQMWQRQDARGRLYVNGPPIPVVDLVSVHLVRVRMR